MAFEVCDETCPNAGEMQQLSAVTAAVAGELAEKAELHAAILDRIRKIHAEDLERGSEYAQAHDPVPGHLEKAQAYGRVSLLWEAMCDTAAQGIAHIDCAGRSSGACPRFGPATKAVAAAMLEAAMPPEMPK